MSDLTATLFVDKHTASIETQDFRRTDTQGRIVLLRFDGLDVHFDGDTPQATLDTLDLLLRPLLALREAAESRIPVPEPVPA